VELSSEESVDIELECIAALGKQKPFKLTLSRAKFETLCASIWTRCLDIVRDVLQEAEVNGTVTAGNASGINDAAAAVVLMERSAAEKRGLKPLARLVSYGHAGLDPKIMGLGPVSAVKRALAKAGLDIAAIDVIESNEAFAAQALGVNKELGLDPAKVNPNGGAVALGHPIGATGCILTIKCIYELQRTGKRYGLVTMCIGGGQGIAAVIERLN
jgi:acetyl-CoA C-acetyltransferase